VCGVADTDLPNLRRSAGSMGLHVSVTGKWVLPSVTPPAMALCLPTESEGSCRLSRLDVENELPSPPS